MQFDKRSARCTMLGGLAILASGCGDGLTKGRAETALEKSFAAQDVCWGTRDMANTRFPLRVNFNSSQRNGNAILGALAQSGLITLSNTQTRASPGVAQGRPVMLIDLTEAGRKANAWNEQNGFCIGTKGVADVLLWTEPTRDSDWPESRVSYTWQIERVPGWARAPAFHSLQGMDEPVEATATLRKMNDGWVVVP